MRIEQMRYVDTSRVEIGNTVGFLGVEDEAVPNKIVNWLNQGLYNSVEDFEYFVETNYAKEFRWDKFNKDEDYKKAIFARFLLNTSKHMNQNENGEYVVDNKVFNGRIYVPKGIKDGKIDVLESNYFTRFAFTEYVKGENATESKYLEKYKNHIKQYDKITNCYLDGFIQSDGKETTLNKLFKESFAVMSHTINILLKTKDGYMYTVRGKDVIGSGEITIITGIVDKKDLEKLIKEEIEEEFGIRKEIGNITQIGCSVVEQISPQRRVVILGLNYEVEVDITRAEIETSHLTAEDRYENEKVFFVKGTINDFIKEVESKDNKSITIKSYIDNIKKNK